jgi:flagellar biosynthesis chaperone FliJ
MVHLWTNLVDIKTESLIKMLNNQRDSLLEQISEFEKKCLEAVQSLNLEKFLDFLNETEKTCENLKHYLNE